MLRVKPGEGNNLMRKYVIPNIRLGATSFLLHETYVPAVRFAAERCDDVSLLLVEPGERNEYLATPGEIVEIGRIIAGERATLHVHLPTDADFDTWEGARSMIGKIRRVAELTGPLDPHSFVLHVDFPSLHGTGGNLPPNSRSGPPKPCGKSRRVCPRRNASPWKTLRPTPPRSGIAGLRARHTPAALMWGISGRTAAIPPLCLRRGSLGCASSICTVWSHAGARRTRQSRKASKRLRKNWRKGTCPACSGLVRVTTSHSGSCRRNSWMM